MTATAATFRGFSLRDELTVLRAQVPTVARALTALTGHPDVARHCERVAARLRGTDPLTRTCELIEETGVTLPA